MLRAIGKITVPAAGTPVRCTSGQVLPTQKFACHGVLIQALFSNTGKVYIGEVGMSKSTLAGVLAVLAAPSGGAIPSFSSALNIAPNGINLTELFIDVDTNAEGVLVTVLVA